MNDSQCIYCGQGIGTLEDKYVIPLVDTAFLGPEEKKKKEEKEEEKKRMREEDEREDKEKNESTRFLCAADSGWQTLTMPTISPSIGISETFFGPLGKSGRLPVWANELKVDSEHLGITFEMSWV
ncbi:hypothetical protein NA57DRAFT_78448 [Rhizodiscina lignyota]|uniref:Uncharacterized protein n=1 Tax=Rhizodiscina lignyota TaxID=1504668 RepID=A0A9P4IB85_9PEZI|nr:hypothetical protein NA57DRAFT_78448 [Rhizodiscina lignyota]